MDQNDKLNLIKKHSPILWLHEKEAFLPTDCKVVIQISDLYRKGNKESEQNQPKELDDLGKIPKSEQCYLKVKDLDLREFTIPESYQKSIPELGPAAIAKLARLKYGYDYATYGIPADDPNLPKYYARVSEVELHQKRGEPFTEFYKNNDPGIFGKYTFIEYFFYFVYNDSWNQHQGDWDSMVEIYIKNDRKYMITHLHHTQWISELPDSSRDLNSWFEHWNSLKKDKLGQAYLMDGHPYVFVAQGAHAGYPTPGFTLHGFDVPGIIFRDDFLTNTDERQIGRLCILPDDVNEETIRTNLRFANIDANRIQFGRWEPLELIDTQPWLKYKGKWGEDTKYLGWDGPQNPPLSRPPDRRNLHAALQKISYSSGSVLKSWHGVR